jgi:2-oxoglutarate dehydrogenase E2 component (dihydrolipoamide succinyltransferase)
MSTDIIMPQLGESVVEGTVSQWLKRVGDTIARFEPLLIVETDKVTTEIPSPVAGVLHAIYVQEGETVAKGTRIAVIADAGNAADEARRAPTGNAALAGTTQASSAAKPQHDPIPSHAADWHLTPVVARMAREHHLDLSAIQGSGRGGRVTKKDVEGYLSSVSSHLSPTTHPADEHAPWETPGSGELFKPTEEYSDAPAAKPRHAPASAPVAPIAKGDTLVPLTPMRKTIAERMIFSRQHYAHVTTVWEIDLTAVQRNRAAQRAAFAAQDVRLTLTPYFIAALVHSLRAVPVLNGEWRDDGMLLHHQQHIGIAVALEDGLIVPVLRDVGDLSLLGIARGVHNLAERARTHKLKAEEVKGGTFTLSNHGVSGSLFATPIITPPQVGILGIGVMEQRVKVIDGMIAIRPCAYASLTFDHRAADGATADAFMDVLKRSLEGWQE